ncbi:MAG: alpha/beta hydrolase [Pirellulaceae bacterium]|nr:alpha/beta hydrolase [Pirellulaceae bacterium]
MNCSSRLMWGTLILSVAVFSQTIVTGRALAQTAELQLDPKQVNAAPPTALPGKKTTWHGFDRYDFVVDGRKSIVVTPTESAAGHPWIWRARFFGHEPQTDLALLRRGFHLVYCDVGNLFGSPKAVAHWNAFYKFLTTKHGFARKVALEGMSRGGLIIYNWAAANPDKVCCIYGDAPVCDFKSWPAGIGRGKGSPGSWQACLKAYDLTEQQALEYRANPIDQLLPLAKANVPLLNVVGEVDQVVPVDENTDVLAQRYDKLGGSIEVIRKPGVGHHPHSLKDPAPIVEFVLKHTNLKHTK